MHGQRRISWNLMSKKTKSMIFNFTKKYQFSKNLSLNNLKIENVEQTKLLGLVLTSDLKWDENTNYLVKESNKRMVMLRAASNFQTFRKEGVNLSEICQKQPQA